MNNTQSRLLGRSNFPGPESWADWKSMIGPTLQTVRVARRMTQNDVAEALSNLIGDQVDQSYISQVEKPDGSVSVDRLLALCEVLDMSPPKLFRLAARQFKDSQKPPEQLRSIGEKRLKKVPTLRDGATRHR